jgi:glycosyltransferase involved in cell wall biosynthesis
MSVFRRARIHQEGGLFMTRSLRNDRDRSRQTAGRPATGRISVGLLSTYLPTRCGVASFTAALRDSLLASRPGVDVGVVRVVDEPTWTSGTGVVYELATGRGGNPAAAAERLNRYDVVVVQHEYGIYGGPDGDQVLDVLSRLRVPVVVVLHTVLSEPTDHQRHVLEQVTAAADTVVTMTRAGQRRLVAGYRIDQQKIVVIPRGAWPGGRPQPAPTESHRPVVLTWGLLGPGKGVEWGIDALPGLRVLDPSPLYVVAGKTHPRVLAREGERYRDSLRERAKALGVSDLVRFEPGYLDLDSLRRLVSRADVVLLPYDSHEQVTSGVLIEAVASLTPVVSTVFPHARELLADGAGTLVPHGDPQAIGAAVHRLLTDPAHGAAMTARAARIAPSLDWAGVADRYWQVAEGLIGRQVGVAG